MNLLVNSRQFFCTMLKRAKTYHGLMNQGATCYLNSVLQVLFMTEDFREAVKRHSSDNPATDFIDLHLTSLFDDLQRYDSYTYKITKKLCIDNVREQRDAAEYFEKILGLTSREASQIFHGQLTQKTTCSCSNETDSDGPFWYLTLALLNSHTGGYSVVAGIEEYFRVSHFSGENQMYCDVCDAKSDATMRCVIKHHPEVLMLLLKRFEFDYRYMSYVKNICTVAVPCTLQIPENQTYELYAVVDHFGDLRSGHYTAKIKAQDDERWYDFNDQRVKPLDFQPFQVDNFEKSSSAYLLFYRKKKVDAADTCTQDTGEMSSPGGFPPATSGIYNDQCQDAAKRGQEVEWAATAGNEPAVAFSRGSRGVGLSSDPFKEDQDNGVYSRQSNHQVYNEDRNDFSYHAETQRDKDQIMIEDHEDKGGNAQADNQTEKRASLSGETLEESVDDPDDVSVRTGDVTHRRPEEGEGMRNTKRKQEVGNMQPQQVSVDMQKDEEKVVTGVNRDEGGRKERRGIVSTKYLDRDAERRDGEGLDHVKQNMYEGPEGTQEVSQDDFKPVSVDKQEDGEGMKTDDEERKSGKGKHFTKCDLYNDDIQGNGVGKKKQNTPKDNQRSKRGSGSRFYQSREQPRVEERDVEGDKPQKRGDDEHAQRKGASERQEQDQNRRSESVTTQREGGAAKRAKGGNEHIQRRADSSAGSSRVTENRGDGSVEKSQPSRARTGRSEDAMEGSSKQSKICFGKIIEEEIITTGSGVQKSTVTKNIRIRSEKGSSQGSLRSLVEYDEENAEIESDQKTDAPVTLSKGVHDLRLKDSLLRKPKKARKLQNVSDAHEHAVGKKHAVKERGEKKRRLWRRFSPLKQNAKDKEKRNRTSGCFPFFCKSRKTADQTSESE